VCASASASSTADDAGRGDASVADSRGGNGWNSAVLWNMVETGLLRRRRGRCSEKNEWRCRVGRMGSGCGNVGWELDGDDDADKGGAWSRASGSEVDEPTGDVASGSPAEPTAARVVPEGPGLLGARVRTLGGLFELKNLLPPDFGEK